MIFIIGLKPLVFQVTPYPFLVDRLTEYIIWSALIRSSLGVVASSGYMAMPKLAVR
jgi:hypothetical protein